MAHGKVGKDMMAPLLTANFVVYIIILGLAGWSLDKYINGEQNHPHLGGNSATPFMLTFALIAGTLSAASLIPGYIHSRVWTPESMTGAATSAVLSWAVMGLAFGLVWKEIRVGGRRGKRLQTLEVFVIISTIMQMMYLILLHAGMMFGGIYGPGGYVGGRAAAAGGGGGRPHEVEKDITQEAVAV